MSTPDQNGPVDHYLDDLFDRLAGTGAAGRRLLAEAEEHLLTASTEGLDEGLDPTEAQSRAVARFGDPETVTSSAPIGNAPSVALRWSVAAWVVTCVLLVVHGVANALAQLLPYPFAFLLMKTDGLGRVNVADPCASAIVGPTVTCSAPPSGPLDFYLAGLPAPLLGGVYVGAVGLILLLPIVLLRGHFRAGVWVATRRATVDTLLALVGIIGLAFACVGVIQAINGPWSMLAGSVAYAVTFLLVVPLMLRLRRGATAGKLARANGQRFV